VNVINLAMGASIIYQNFIALNKWGHVLKPDAIISFSGHNELVVPASMKSDDYGGAETAGAIQYVFRYSSSPPWLKTLAQYFPGIVKRTDFGSLVRFLYFKKYRAEWRAAYEKMPPDATLAETVEKISIPLYVHSLESISRDFPSIPIFAVFQPLATMPTEYRALKAAVAKKVAGGESSEKIHFIDLSDEWQNNSFYPGSLVDSVHLSNAGHALVADYLTRYLLPFVKERCSTLKPA
jgi:hypothetical protein